MPNPFPPLLICACSLLLVACATPAPHNATRAHLNQETASVLGSSLPETPKNQDISRQLPETPRWMTDRYSLTVNQVSVRDLLFAISRDSGLDIDIAPGITGSVTLNAVQQTLPVLLQRIARQIPLRFEFQSDALLILPDSPYLKHYPIDYLNLSRSITASVSNNMQIGGSNPGGPGTTAGGLSNTKIENTTQHRFWESLEKNLRRLLVDRSIDGEDKIKADSHQSASQGQAQLVIHPEASLISIFASSAQHQQIQSLIEQLTHSLRRQVMIEATIVEVSLGQGHEQGIDWGSLVRGGMFEFAGNSLKGGVNLRYQRDNDSRALISLLERFGTSRVLSSPRLSALNNQTALLKVVENYVYFSVKTDTTSTANVGTTVTYSTTPQTVSVGLVMGVTAQIAADDSVVLNIRPTITSIGREIADPNPDLRKNGIENLVPIIRTREIESVMRVANGQIAVLGGLMEDRIDYRSERLPLLGEIPLVGEIFHNRNNRAQKTELVIFLRPVVIRQPSLEVDFRELANHLPGPADFQPPDHARHFQIQLSGRSE